MKARTQRPHRPPDDLEDNHWHREKECPCENQLDNSPDNPEAFHRKRFIYGADSRNAAGYTMWQLCYASRQPLTPASYAAARQAISGFKADHGRPLGLKGDTLLVDSSNEQAGLKIVNNLLIDGGNTNEWAGTAKLVMSPWMA